jgi:hypothetical protein
MKKAALFLIVFLSLSINAQDKDIQKLYANREFIHLSHLGIENWDINQFPIFIQPTVEEGTFEYDGFLGQKREKMSRRDNTLLTVGFKLRPGQVKGPLLSPAGTTLRSEKVPSLRDLKQTWIFSNRRLKPTVNKVLSLRDISPQS